MWITWRCNMLRKWVSVLLLLCLGFMLPDPAAAQGVDLANRAPANTLFYGEAVIDASLESNLTALMAILSELSGSPVPPVELDEALEMAFFGKSFEADILPRLGGRAALGILDIDITQPLDDQEINFFVLLPVTDAAYFQSLLPPDTPEPAVQGDMFIYNNVEGMALFIMPEMIGLGTPRGVDAAIATIEGGQPTLGESPAFQQIWAEIPAGALASGYLSGPWLAAVGSQIPPDVTGNISLDTIFQAIMKLHPAESAMEDALLASPPLNGLGFALELADDRLDLTVLLGLDSQYPTPTLATASAGAGLLDYVPAGSFLVLDSYDAAGTLGLTGGGVGVLALLGPTIGNIFEDIVFTLENPGVPTPTPPPTATPPPPLTVDSIIAQAQPVIQQAEAILGITLDDLYTLLAGEYAFALFSTPDPNTNYLGGAFWFQTPDPARLGAVVDKAMALFVAQVTTGSVPALSQSVEMVNGVEVTIWRYPQNLIGFAYGALSDTIFFLTLESSLDQVLAASRGDGVLPQTPAWPGAIVEGYGQGVDLLLYADMVTIVQKSNPFGPAQPARQINTLVSMLDIRENGLFRLQFTLPRSPVNPDA
jgi:hypothetical protein